MYSVSFTKTALKQLCNLPKSVQNQAIEKVKKLEENPRYYGCIKKLTGREGYRIRFGDYRIIYLIDDGKLIF